ncbi:MAG TPA: hypothetical protein VKA94_15525 [Hyphomicrobiales bacterium]|nr:hypothetical protein [Hyphomicrobiales bacterium]
MAGVRTIVLAAAGFAALIAASAGAVRSLQFSYAHPTPEEYMQHLGGKGQLSPAGALSYDDTAFNCARFPTIFDPTMKDYGAAYFGFIMLNKERFEQMPLTLKRYAYTHECGHQYVGFNEDDADCYAIRRGRKDGWLDSAALDEICAFISRSKGDGVHALGEQRCEKMRQCYSDAARNS